MQKNLSNYKHYGGSLSIILIIFLFLYPIIQIASIIYGYVLYKNSYQIDAYTSLISGPTFTFTTSTIIFTFNAIVLLLMTGLSIKSALTFYKIEQDAVIKLRELLFFIICVNFIDVLLNHTIIASIRFNSRIIEILHLKFYLIIILSIIGYLILNFSTKIKNLFKYEALILKFKISLKNKNNNLAQELLNIKKLKFNYNLSFAILCYLFFIEFLFEKLFLPDSFWYNTHDSQFVKWLLGDLRIIATLNSINFEGIFYYLMLSLLIVLALLKIKGKKNNLIIWSLIISIFEVAYDLLYISRVSALGVYYRNILLYGSLDLIINFLIYFIYIYLFVIIINKSNLQFWKYLVGFVIFSIVINVVKLTLIGSLFFAWSQNYLYDESTALSSLIEKVYINLYRYPIEPVNILALSFSGFLLGLMVYLSIDLQLMKYVRKTILSK